MNKNTVQFFTCVKCLTVKCVFFQGKTLRVHSSLFLLAK